MKRRFAVTTLSACLLMTCFAAYADPPWARGGDEHGGYHGHHGEGHGYGHMKHWERGDYYSGPREQRWMVGDWRRHRGLWAPPVGYYWMQSGGQYLLMAAATGLIAGVAAATVGAVPPAYPVPY
ncbi:MAG: RcnB family protein [Gluconacetobacter sp.]